MRKKILFIYPNYSTFVKTDFEILSSEHDVIKHQFKPVKGLFKTGVEFAKQFLYLLFNIWKFDSVFIWFADYHSFLPVVFSRILNKKSFVVIGGYDVCRIPKLKYGAFYKKTRGFFTLNSMKYCTLNLTVSVFVDRIVKAIAPNANRKLIYNCINIKTENNSEEKFSKDNTILTVGLISNKQTFYRKGIDTFIETAKLLPEYRFVCVGISAALVKNIVQDIPINVIFFSRTKQSELIYYYKKAKIYAQFSRMDTFCLTIAEAMIYKCIPVITNVGGMPEVVGNSGFLVKQNPKKIAQLIIEIIENNKVPNRNGQKRIKTMFELVIRKEKLLKNFL